MKNGWEIKTIGDVCKVIAGQSPEGKFYNDNENGLPFYQGKKEYGEKYIGEPTTWTTKVTKEAEANDILMSVRAPVGPINFATQKICIGRGLAAIRATKLIDKEFLFNFLLKHESEIVGNTGAVFNSINKAQIEAIEIPLPPLPEQQRIVSILDEVFSAIERSRNNAEQNLKNAKELFESYLQGVFERKSSELGFIELKDEQDFKGDKKNSKKKILKSSNLENSNSDNGEGWEHTRLGDVCKINDGTHFSPKNNSDGEYMYITAKNIKPYFIDLTKISYISEKDHREIYARCYPVKGDVLYIKDGATAGIAALNSLDVEFSLLSSVALLKCSSKILNTFLVHYMNSTIGKENFLGYIDGAAITRLTLIKIKNVCFSLPSLKTQQTIVQKLDALSAEIKKLEAIYQQKINDLEELKKSVLQKAFSGELTLIGSVTNKKAAL